MTRRPILNLTIMSGPDAGKWARFDQDTVTLGRARGNDFFLQDRFVSNNHGEFVREEDGFIYQDLQSRHGSLVVVDQKVGVRLHRNGSNRPVRILSGGEIQVGSSVIRLRIGQLSEEEAQQKPKEPEADYESHEKYITTVHEPQAALTRRVTGKDPRLRILFGLAGQLNGLNRLEDLLGLIVQATFEAFPTADFFSINLLEDNGLRPFMSRVRGALEETNAPSIISQSLLQRVVETREAVLFVRDGMSGDLSKSILEGQIYACMAAPLVGQRSLLGVMHVDTRDSKSLFSRQDLDLFSVFASNVAFALERTRLTENIYEMFEGFVQASVSAIEARDPTTAGHSERVATYSLRLAEVVNQTTAASFEPIHFTDEQLTELRYAALLHDFGKVGVRESVLMKATRLPEPEITNVRERFNLFKEVHWRHQTDGLLQRLMREGRHPTSEDMEVLRYRHAQFVSELDAFMSFMDTINSRSRLEPEQIAHVQAMGRRMVFAANDERVTLLTQGELENLTIRSGTLNDLEMEDMRSHVAQSEAFLNQIPWSEELRQVPCIAGAHHEKLDGSGYPRGLAGDEIPLRVRILTVADIFDAVTAWDRPYRPAASIEDATRILRLESDSGKLDVDLVSLFVGEVIPSITHLIPKQS